MALGTENPGCMHRRRRFIETHAVHERREQRFETREADRLTTAGRKRRAWLLAALVVLAIAGAGLAAQGSRAGVGLSQDSFVYLSAARNLEEGRGLTVSPCVGYESGSSAAPGQAPVPLTHFPPLYAAELAALGALGLDLRDAARWTNVALLSVNAAIIGWTLFCRCRSLIPPLVATLWMVLSVDLINLHVMAWSEPLSLALGLGGLIVLGSWLDHGARRASLLPLAAALTGLSAATRYAGIVYACVGAVGLLAMGWAPRPRRLRTAVLFVGLAAIPLLLVSFRNAATTGSAHNRQLGFLLPARADPPSSSDSVLLDRTGDPALRAEDGRRRRPRRIDHHSLRPGSSADR